MNNKQAYCDEYLLNRLMKEYLVHIEVEDRDNVHRLTFRSSSLTVLFLAIDDFRKTISNTLVSDTSAEIDAQSVLQSLTTNMESQLMVVDQQDQLDEQEKATSTRKIRQGTSSTPGDDDDEETAAAAARARQEPQLKILYPGAE